MLTHDSVIARLSALSLMLEPAAEAIEQADEAHVRAKIAYEVAFARAQIEASGPMDIRKSTATLMTEHQRLAMELAGVVLRACKERIAVVKGQIDVGRSIGAAQRTEIAAFQSTASYTP